MDKVEKGKEYNTHYTSEPRTNIWYHGTPDNLGGPEVSRVTELAQTLPIDTGLNYRFNLNLDYDDITQMHKQEDIKGILKLDVNNPIWQHSNDDIKNALVNKVRENYYYVQPQDLKIIIDRNKNILQYEYKKTKEILSTIVMAEEGEKEIYFQDLTVGEIFQIDPQILQSKYPAFYKNPQFKKAGNFNRETKWKKTSVGTFCLFYEGGKCIEAYVSFEDVAIGSEFEVYALDKNYQVWLGYVKQQLGRDLMQGEVCIKLSENSFKIKEDSKILKINQPLALQVYFKVFIIEVDKEIAPVGSIALKDVPVGSIFVFTTASVKKIYWDKGIKPGETKFIKMTQNEFYLWKPGKFNENIIVDFNEQMKEMGFVDDEEIRQKYEKLQKQKYIIDNSLIPEENNWGGRRVSPGSFVLVLSEQDFKTKKKSTMDDLLGSLFGKYEVQKSDMGQSLTISPVDLERELSSVGLTNTDFAKLTREDTIKMPTGEYEDAEKTTPKYKDFATKIGNTENYYWYLNEKGNWSISNVKTG